MGALNAQHRFFTAALGPAVLTRGHGSSRCSCWRGEFGREYSTPRGGRARGRAGSAPRSAARALASRGSPSPVVGMVAPGRAGHCRPALARGVRPGRGPGHRARQHTLASLFPQGTVSYLYYADRVMEFPTWASSAFGRSPPRCFPAWPPRRREESIGACGDFRIRAAPLAFIRGSRGRGPARTGVSHRALPLSSGASSARRSRGHHPGPRRLRGRPSRFLGDAHRRPDLLCARDTRTPVWVGFASVVANVALGVSR